MVIIASRPETYEENFNICEQGKDPCIICGKGITHERQRYTVHAHYGDMDKVVTETEANALNAAGEEGSDMGGWPIGANCLKQHPELKGYVWDSKKEMYV